MSNKKMLISSIFILLFLNACGSSSSTETKNSTPESNDTTQENNDSTEGSAECVDLPAVKDGDTYTIRTKDTTSKAQVDVQIVATNVSSTSMTFDTITTGAISSTGTKVETFTIQNNYIDISKIVTNDTTTTQGITIDTNVTLEFSPYLRSAYTRTCKGATWVDEYDLKTTTTILNIPTSANTHTKRTLTVESINESKTIGLGTYTTMRIKTVNSDGTTQINWSDLNEAKLIYSEGYDATGKLITTQELIQD